MPSFTQLNNLRRAVFSEEAKTGAFFRKPLQGLKTGYQFSYGGSMMFMLPAMAIFAATADRGEKAGAIIGTAAAPLGTLVGGSLAGPWGALAGTILADTYVGQKVAHGVNAFAKFGGRIRSVEMGRGFEDNDRYYTMRQRAAGEMGNSLLNARQYLGKEALLMHQ